MKRRWIVLTDGYLEERNAKTAHGVIRYAQDEVVAIIDHDHAGTQLEQVMPSLRREAPIVASVKEALQYEPTSLLLGVATPGGWMPDHWRAWILEAIDAGLEIANGLHTMLHDDDEFVKRAAETGARLWDVREPPADIPLNAGRAIDAPQRIAATVGSDCAVGKMTVSVELAEAGRDEGVATEFVATGQTGILIAGRGIAVDRVISDFTAGAAERLVLESDPSSEVLIVEGQGGLWHPAYSGVTLSLLHGSAPEALVFCHQWDRDAVEEPPYTKLPALDEMIAAYETIASVVRPCKVACIALNTLGLSKSAARAEVERLEDETGLPTGDVFAGEAGKLWNALYASLTS
jgi:uncharacterized NAD-dependent epimerase/dehydratase family protein